MNTSYLNWRSTHVMRLLLERRSKLSKECLIVQFKFKDAVADLEELDVVNLSSVYFAHRMKKLLCFSSCSNFIIRLKNNFHNAFNSRSFHTLSSKIKVQIHLKLKSIQYRNKLILFTTRKNVSS